MKKGRAVGTTAGSKKAAELTLVNAELSPLTGKRTNFQMVAVGACPHDNAKLLPPAKTKGEGTRAVCSECGHTWYINKKIRTCKCLTCSAAKEKPQDSRTMENVGTNGGKQIKNGPFWTRTRDLSLIRSGEPVKLRNCIDAWYNEQKLKGLTEVTVSRYRQQVETLLNEYPVPSEFDIKSFLTKKQEFGACSGTIANYVKAYRSFFGYLFEKGWYNIDPRCLPLPKVHNRERRVPSDEDIAKLLSVAHSLEDKLALLLLIDCGLRVSELAAVKLKNIKLRRCKHLDKR